MKKTPKEIEKILPKKSKLLVFCGYHGVFEKKDTYKMGPLFNGFFNDVTTSLKAVEKEHKQKMKEIEIYPISDNIQQISLIIGETMKESVEKVINRIFKQLKKQEEPSVIFLASCFSQYTDFKEFLFESGVCSIAALKIDRGIITKGKCFELDDNQFRILEEFKDDHQNAKKIGDLKIRNLYVSGPFGCGKTVIIVEVCWMRICFCLRMIREQGELHFFLQHFHVI